MRYASIIGGGQLEATAAANWNQLEEAYKARFGAYLAVVSALRTRAEQTRLYNGWIARKPGFSLAARPGTSLHERGLSVDVAAPANVDGSVQHEWLEANGPSFGFKWTGAGFRPVEAWHFDFVGGGSAAGGNRFFSREQYRAVQGGYAALGYNLGTSGADGIEGPTMRGIVKDFQAKHNLDPDGIHGPKTEAALIAAQPKPTPAPSRGVLERGSKGAAVKQLQEVLNAKFPLYSKLVEDGDFGPATEKVVRELQTRAHLTVDGKAGPQVFGYLGI